MGFKSRATTITVDIDDKEYTIDASGNDFMQQMIKAGEFMSNDLSKLNDIEDFDERSKLVRKGISMILGEENAKKVFKDRPYDLVTETEMLLYLYDEVNNSDVYTRLNSIAKKYNINDVIQPDRAAKAQAFPC